MRERATQRVTVTSFTRAAAAEIAGRDLQLDRKQVGTLHSLAMQALDVGRDDLAHSHLDDWNEKFPQYAISKTRGDVDAVSPEGGGNGGSNNPGDELLERLDYLRATLVPSEHWLFNLRAFYDNWSQWKHDNDLKDFTDLIADAITDTETAVGNPLVIFADEVQDCTPLQLRLVRHWGQSADRLILAGDDDQLMYGHLGASVEALIGPEIPDENKRFLSQSYRVPRAVHAAASQWIERVEYRQPKEYSPRDEEGEVLVSSTGFNYPGPLVAEAAEHVEAGRTVMFLASCHYMLTPILDEMRRIGVPFGNHLRPDRREWSPLRPPTKGVGAAERLLSYLIIDEEVFGEMSRLWTGNDVRRWINVLKTRGTFVSKVSDEVAQLHEGELSYEEVARLFSSEEELEKAVTPSLDWYESRLNADGRKRLAYPIAVARRDPRALLVEPKICPSTIHGAKGGESQIVYLSNELSFAGMRQWGSGSGRDAIVRQFYVAMTRASETLVLCPSNKRGLAIDPSELIGAGR